MNKRGGLILVLSFLFLWPSIFGQRGYRPGTVITKNGDIIRCRIDFDKNETNPSTIKIIRESSHNPGMMSTNIVKEFIFDNGERYVSGVASLAKARIDRQKKKYAYDTLTIHAFFKVLVQGDSVSLYSLNESQHFFIKGYDNPDVFIQLEYFDLGSYAVEDDDPGLVAYVTAYYGYRHELRRYIHPADAYQYEIDKLDFDQQHLQAAVIHINTPGHLTYLYQAPPTKTVKMSPFFGVGASYNHWSIANESGEGINYTPSLYPAAELGVEMGPINLLNLIPILLRISLSYNYSSMSYSGPVGNNATVSDFSYHIHTLTPKLGVLTPIVSISKSTIIYTGFEVGLQNSFMKAGNQIWHYAGQSYQDNIHNSHFIIDPWTINWLFTITSKRVALSSFIQLTKYGFTADDGSYTYKSHGAGLIVSYHFK